MKFVLTSAHRQENKFVYNFDVSKVAKSAAVELNLNATTQLNFETVIKHEHQGYDHYLTLGAIGERYVHCLIWNNLFEVVEVVTFMNKWKKVGDYVFNLRVSTKDTADIFIKKQDT